MACLGSVLYDPAAAVSKATSSLLAMTALDTTNLRITFTAPANGTVLVKLRATVHGGTANPMYLLGVLDGSTVRGRMVPMSGPREASGATQRYTSEAVFLVTGLTPSSSYTWDAAYGVETLFASSAIKYGGPNNTTTNDAFGAFGFEIWETTNLLAGKLYDPGTAVNKATSSLLAMTALDTTNLRHTFTVPASGRVLVRLAGATRGSTANPNIMLGVLNGSTVVARQHAMGGTQQMGALAATDFQPQEATFVVGGLTPSASLTWDAAYGVEIVQAGNNLSYGGPNDTTADNAWGGFAYEIWTA